MFTVCYADLLPFMVFDRMAAYCLCSRKPRRRFRCGEQRARGSFLSGVDLLTVMKASSFAR